MTKKQKKVVANKSVRDVMIALCAAVLNVGTALPFSEKVDYLTLGKQIAFQAVLIFAFRYLREQQIKLDDVTPTKID